MEFRNAICSLRHILYIVLHKKTIEHNGTWLGTDKNLKPFKCALSSHVTAATATANKRTHTEMFYFVVAACAANGRNCCIRPSEREREKKIKVKLHFSFYRWRLFVSLASLCAPNGIHTNARSSVSLPAFYDCWRDYCHTNVYCLLFTFCR